MSDQPQSPAQVTQLIQSEINRELLSSHLHAFNTRARKLKMKINNKTQNRNVASYILATK